MGWKDGEVRGLPVVGWIQRADGLDRFVATLRGHVGAVYRLTWSADSRMLISASKDSTVKVSVLLGRHFCMLTDLFCIDMGSEDVQVEDGSTWSYRRGVLCRFCGGQDCQWWKGQNGEDVSKRLHVGVVNIDHLAAGRIELQKGFIA